MTDYVIIIQHDQIFLRNIDFKDVINMMIRHDNINFLFLQTINYESKLISRYNIFYEDYKKNLIYVIYQLYHYFFGMINRIL